jgi:hypothetical protein
MPSSGRNISVLMLLWCVDQGPGATAELAALVHGVAGLVGLLLSPDVPLAAQAQVSIDRSVAALPVLTCLKAPSAGTVQAKANHPNVGSSALQRFHVHLHWKRIFLV